MLDLATGESTRVSTGKGRTTCGYFYDHDRRVLFASTHLAHRRLPAARRLLAGLRVAGLRGYDIFTARRRLRPERLTETPGYDAEATLSVDGKWIVFTSVRDGDLDLYSMHPDGTDVKRLTNHLGYDGGAFFSRDGKWICFRAFSPTGDALADYRELLEQLVRPAQMDLWVMNADGTQRRKVTTSRAPRSRPTSRPTASSSSTPRTGRPRAAATSTSTWCLKGGEPVAVTRDPSFDGFPMFSPDGQLAGVRVEPRRQGARRDQPVPRRLGGVRRL